MFVVLDAKTREFMLCKAKETEKAWAFSENIADLEPCEYSIYGKYTHHLWSINRRQATHAGFRLCAGKEKALIALYLHNVKKSNKYKSAPCNVQSIEDKLSAILDGYYWIRNFDGKYSFECVYTDEYANSPILCIDIKNITIKTKPSEIHYANNANTPKSANSHAL